MDDEKYIRLVIDFVNMRYDELFMSKYKYLHVYNYCLSMSDDNVDKDRIKFIIKIVLKYLLDNGFLINFKDCFMTKKKIDEKINIKLLEYKYLVNNN